MKAYRNSSLSIAYSIYCKFCYRISDFDILNSQEFDPISQICYGFDYRNNTEKKIGQIAAFNYGTNVKAKDHRDHTQYVAVSPRILMSTLEGILFPSLEPNLSEILDKFYPLF